MRILVTGFEPFGGSLVNPSEQLVHRIAEHDAGGMTLRTLILPCRFATAGRLIAAAIDEWEPEAVVSFGQGGGTSVAVERVGVNLEDARLPDNAGDQPDGRPVVTDGPAAYFATLPVKAIVRALQAGGVPARLSLSAGTFVCNHVLYSTLHHLAQRHRAIPVGFIHVPKLPVQVAEAGLRDAEPSMGLETLATAAEIILATIAAERPVVSAGGMGSAPSRRQSPR